MIPAFKRLRAEFEKRFNPSYWRYRRTRESREIDSYLDSLGRGGRDVRFSIVVPTYGIPLHYVEEFVASCFRQTHASWELCLHDDGDPNPAVGDYLERLAARNPKLVVVSRASGNHGICEATKRALSLATADYVLLADVDDTLHPRALEIFAATIAAHPTVDFVYSNHDYLTDWGLRLFPMIKPGWSPELLLHVNYINHAKVVRRSLLDRIAPAAFDSSFNGAQDWNLCFRILQHAESVRHIPFFLYHWRTRKGSMADDVFSKPWAVEAQLRLRQLVISELSPRLSFDANGNRVDFAKTDESHVETVRLPLAIGNATAMDRLKNALEFVMATASGSKAEFLHFRTGDCDPLAGERTSIDEGEQRVLAAYTLLPKVACVWGTRADRPSPRYTIAHAENGQTILAQAPPSRSSYGGFTSNALAGSLDGMTIHRALASELAAKVLASPLPTVFEGDPLDVAGALLSLAALASGRRNATVVTNPTSQNERDLAPIALPSSFAPAYDPYL